MRKNINGVTSNTAHRRLTKFLGSCIYASEDNPLPSDRNVQGGGDVDACDGPGSGFPSCRDAQSQFD